MVWYLYKQFALLKQAYPHYIINMNKTWNEILFYLSGLRWDLESLLPLEAESGLNESRLAFLPVSSTSGLKAVGWEPRRFIPGGKLSSKAVFCLWSLELRLSGLACVLIKEIEINLDTLS